MNRPEEIKAALLSALKTDSGVIYRIDGEVANQRAAALAAIITAKRSLLPDEPEMINIRIQPVPGSPDEIAIIHLKGTQVID